MAATSSNHSAKRTHRTSSSLSAGSSDSGLNLTAEAVAALPPPGKLNILFIGGIFGYRNFCRLTHLRHHLHFHSIHQAFRAQHRSSFLPNSPMLIKREVNI